MNKHCVYRRVMACCLVCSKHRSCHGLSHAVLQDGWSWKFEERETHAAGCRSYSTRLTATCIDGNRRRSRRRHPFSRKEHPRSRVVSTDGQLRVRPGGSRRRTHLSGSHSGEAIWIGQQPPRLGIPCVQVLFKVSSKNKNSKYTLKLIYTFLENSATAFLGLRRLDECRAPKPTRVLRIHTSVPLSSDEFRAL